MNKPNKVHISANGRKYIIVENPTTGKNERLFLDKGTLEVWDDISEITVGVMDYHQRTADQAAVDAGKAEKIGDLYDEDWSRLEVVDYVTYGSIERKVEHEVKVIGMKKAILTTEEVEALAEALA